jgi:hypothetical protein
MRESSFLEPAVVGSLDAFGSRQRRGGDLETYRAIKEDLREGSRKKRLSARKGDCKEERGERREERGERREEKREKGIRVEEKMRRTLDGSERERSRGSREGVAAERVCRG